MSASTSSRRSTSQCRQMAFDVVKLYISLISEFFNLSDMAVMTSPTGPKSPRPDSPFLPINSHSMSTAHYLGRVLGEIQEGVNELKALNMHSDVGQALKGFQESVNWRFVDILINAWQRGRSLLPPFSTDAYRPPQMHKNSITSKLGYLILRSLQLHTTLRKLNSFSAKLLHPHSNLPAGLIPREVEVPGKIRFLVHSCRRSPKHSWTLCILF
jgi:hypothetical protein